MAVSSGDSDQGDLTNTGIVGALIFLVTLSVTPLAKRLRESEALIMSECLAVKISLLDQADDSCREVEVEGEKVLLSITKV